MDKRVCIDGFNLSNGRGSGIATYGRNLNLAIRRIGCSPQVLYGPRAAIGRNPLLNAVALNDAPEALAKAHPSSRRFAPHLSMLGRTARWVPQTDQVFPSPATRRVDSDGIWAANDLFHTANRAHGIHRRFTPVRFEAAGQKPDLMHWTAPLPLKAPGKPNVYTVHDLVPLRLPFTTLDNKRRFYALCKTLCRTADHIVTVSEAARLDLIRMFGIGADRVTNTYQSVDFPPALLEQPDSAVASEVEGIFGLGWKRYFLFFGAVEPKKNLGRIIEAYLASGVGDPLVVIGPDGWLTEFETKMLRDDLVGVQSSQDGKIRRADRIRRYDYLPFASLVSLIRGAKATLFPSLYEGFGLPVLESMTLGAPVLTSTAGSLPEVAGDACLLVDPHDTQAIMRGIRALDADEGLCEELTRKGREQAAKFSLEAHSRRLAEIYSRLA